MSFEIQTLETQIPNVINQGNADLPVKEFVGFDPNGTTTITNSPRLVPEPVAKQEVISEEEPKSVTLSPKLTAIARREQSQRQREQELRQKEKEFAGKLAQAEQYEALKAKLAAKDYSAAEELGIKYDEFTNHLVESQAKKNPEEERYRKVQEELNSLKKAQEEKEIRDWEDNQKLWKQEISKVVSSDDFSTIKELGAEALVLQHINESFEEDGVELSAEEAAKEIESALLERAEKLSSVSKLKRKTLGPPKESAPKTITQNMTVSSQKPVKKPFHLMSESEQIAEAFRRVQEARMQR